MIDWVTLIVRPEHMPIFGKNTKSDEFGVIEKVTVMPKNIKSSSTSIFVMPWGDDLLISGNPSKFIQGHNVFSHDSWHIVEEMLKRVLLELHAGFNYSILKMTRIDINYGLVFNSHNDVELALSSLMNTTADKWGRPVSKVGTVYFGSRKRQLLKIYAKAPEFRRNMKNTDYSSLELLPILRPELTLGRNYFEDNDWKLLKVEKYRKLAWENAMKRIRINELSTFDSSVLPRNLLKVYGLWRSGIDLKTIYKLGTLYQYASKLRKYNIDIYQKPIENNVVNLSRALESRPLTYLDCENMGLPVWFGSVA